MTSERQQMTAKSITLSQMKVVLITFIMVSRLAGQFLIPEWRGAGPSSHAEWDLFSHAKFEANTPDVVPDPDAGLLSSTSSAFLTSARNIYSFQSPLSLQLDDTTPLEVRNIFLQIRTLGVGLNTGDALLLHENEEGETVATSPSRVLVIGEEDLTGERGGTGTNYALQWDLRETPVTGSYTILFGATTTSLSLDRVSLDLSESYQEVARPEPLQVRVVGDEVVVTWFGTRQLQSSGSLSGGWEVVPGSAGVNEIRLPLQGSTTFFRLKQASITE